MNQGITRRPGKNVCSYVTRHVTLIGSWQSKHPQLHQSELPPCIQCTGVRQTRRKMFVHKRKKKSINNQTTEYNENDENTTVKDLQRRATFKRCVTKRLSFILSVFCLIDQKNSNTGKRSSTKGYF